MQMSSGRPLRVAAAALVSYWLHAGTFNVARAATTGHVLLDSVKSSSLEDDTMKSTKSRRIRPGASGWQFGCAVGLIWKNPAVLMWFDRSLRYVVHCARFASRPIAKYYAASIAAR